MALNNETAALLVQSLKDITENANQCFTAYDITKSLRSLTDERIKHYDVRALVHAFYDHGFLDRYNRIDHIFYHNGSTNRVQLFVPLNGDPSTYDPDKIQIIKETEKSTEEQDASDPVPFDLSIGSTSSCIADAQSNWSIGVTGIMGYRPPDYKSQTKFKISGFQGSNCQGYKPQTKESIKPKNFLDKATNWLKKFKLP